MDCPKWAGSISIDHIQIGTWRWIGRIPQHVLRPSQDGSAVPIIFGRFFASIVDRDGISQVDCAPFEAGSGRAFSDRSTPDS
jgi:hypothetical protein